MGMEFRPYYLAREWVKKGHKVDIIAADFSHLRRVNPKIERNFDVTVIDGINYHWIKTNSYKGNGFQRSITMAKFISVLLRKAKWIVDNMDPDVVIASSTYPLDTYVGQKIKKLSLKNVKLIHEVHDMWPATLYEVGGMSKHHPFVSIMQIGENSAYKHSDHVVSLLPNAEPYMKKHGLGNNKFTCIPNGIVAEEWENPQKIPTEYQQIFDEFKSRGKFVVGYFGGHSISNALDVLIDSANAIEDKQVQFVLVGRGIEKQKLMDRAKAYNLDNVTFLEPIPKKSIPDLCKNFDCIYMGGMDSPLYRFGICLNKMFDTMASGKPGICAFNMKTYFSEYDCGIDTKIDTKSICSAIEKIKNMSAEELKKMSDNGKKASENYFNYEAEAKRFIEIMNEGER